MISDYRCFFCFTKAFQPLLEEDNLTTGAKNSFTCEMAALYQKNLNNFSAPVFSRELHMLLKQYSQNPDPYKVAKQQSNDLVLGMYPHLETQVLQSGDPFDTSLRLAIAGNIIDFAISREIDLQSTLDKVLHSEFAVDHSKELKQALSTAKTVLYLGDNCGEIVFDKLFITQLNHPNLYYAVRGAPIINDATMDDAIYVGMEKVARVISNGYDAPSTLPEHCSAAFNDVFDQADVIISKGQGNLEGLLDKTDKEIYFLLMVKCDVIADALHVRNGDFVVKKDKTSK